MLLLFHMELSCGNCENEACNHWKGHVNAIRGSGFCAGTLAAACCQGLSHRGPWLCPNPCIINTRSMYMIRLCAVDELGCRSVDVSLSTPLSLCTGSGATYEWSVCLRCSARGLSPDQQELLSAREDLLEVQ